jgi:hypothetical protein
MRVSLLVALPALCLTLPAAAQTAPLVAHWALDESTGTTAKDASANANDGTLRNFAAAPWVAGKFGNALQFDGVDDFVEIGIKAGLPLYRGTGAACTIAFWVRGAPGQNDVRIYTEGGAASNNPLFTIGTGRTSDSTTDRLQVFLRSDANISALNARSTAVVFDNAWHHVAWVDVAGQAVLYVDGVPDKTDWDYRFTGPQTRSFGPFTTSRVGLGAVVRPTMCCYFAGALDDFRVYQSALSATDVAALVANGPHPPARASVGKLGVGCGDGPLDLHFTGSAQLGRPLLLRLHRGRPAAAAVLGLGGAPAPLDLGPLGFRNCILYPPLVSLQTFAIGALDSTGTSTLVPVAIPSNTALAGLVLSLQGMTLGGPPLSIELSPAVLPQLGI